MWVQPTLITATPSYGLIGALGNVLSWASLGGFTESYGFGEGLGAYTSGPTPQPVSTITALLGFNIAPVDVPALNAALPFLRAAWINVFNLDGISLSLYPSAIDAAPNVTVAGLGLVTNQDSGCSFAFHLDGADGPPGSATLIPNVIPTLHAPSFPASIVVSFDAEGVPTAGDTSGTPFAPVAFPAVQGARGHACAPAAIGARAPLLVGTPTAVAEVFPGSILHLVVA